MDTDLGGVDLGVVVNIRTLREVLAEITDNGRSWWIASDPADAIKRSYVSIGHGDPRRKDRLNTLYYRVPVLSEEQPVGGSDYVVVLLEAGMISAEQPGLYREGGRVLEDPVEDMQCFWLPMKRAFARKLQE